MAYLKKVYNDTIYHVDITMVSPSFFSNIKIEKERVVRSITIRYHDGFNKLKMK